MSVSVGLWGWTVEAFIHGMLWEENKYSMQATNPSHSATVVTTVNTSRSKGGGGEEPLLELLHKRAKFSASVNRLQCTVDGLWI